MGIFKQTKFHGDPGVALRTGSTNNTGQNGDDAADIISPNNSPQATFSDEISSLLTGGTVLKVSPAGTGTHYAYRWDNVDAASMGGAVQLAGIVFTGPPPSLNTTEFTQNRGTAQSVRMRMDGDEIWVNGASTSPSAFSGSRLNLATHSLYGVPLCIDYLFRAHADSAQRRLAMRVRRMDDLDGTPLVDYDVTGTSGADVGSTPIYNYWLLGSQASSAWMAPYYVMGYAMETDRETFLPDPELAQEVVASFTRSVQHRIDFSGSLNATTLTLDSQTGPTMGVSIDGLVAIATDVPGRTQNTTLNFTVSNGPSSVQQSVTIPIAQITGGGPRLWDSDLERWT